MSYGVLDPLTHFQDNTCLPVTIYEKRVINGEWNVAEYLSFRLELGKRQYGNNFVML